MSLLPTLPSPFLSQLSLREGCYDRFIRPLDPVYSDLAFAEVTKDIKRTKKIVDNLKMVHSPYDIISSRHYRIEKQDQIQSQIRSDVIRILDAPDIHSFPCFGSKDERTFACFPEQDNNNAWSTTIYSFSNRFIYDSRKEFKVEVFANQISSAVSCFRVSQYASRLFISQREKSMFIDIETQQQQDISRKVVLDCLEKTDNQCIFLQTDGLILRDLRQKSVVFKWSLPDSIVSYDVDPFLLSYATASEAKIIDFRRPSCTMSSFSFDDHLTKVSTLSLGSYSSGGIDRKVLAIGSQNPQQAVTLFDTKRAFQYCVESVTRGVVSQITPINISNEHTFLYSLKGDVSLQQDSQNLESGSRSFFSDYDVSILNILGKNRKIISSGSSINSRRKGIDQMLWLPKTGYEVCEGVVMMMSSSEETFSIEKLKFSELKKRKKIDDNFWGDFVIR